METTRLERLASFIKFLEDSIGYRFDIGSFDSRLKLQKLVFIAGFLGFKHGYDFSLYLRGPYSPDLANDYYKLGEEWSFWKHRKDLPVIRFDEENFVKLIRGKNSIWLETAATILSIWEKYHEKETVIELTKNIKMLRKDVVEDVFKDLRRSGVI